MIIQDSVESTLKIIALSHTASYQSLGLGKVKSLLNPNAVPSLFEKPASLKRKIELTLGQSVKKTWRKH